MSKAPLLTATVGKLSSIRPITLLQHYPEMLAKGSRHPE
jgi:hypothetical protein